MGKEKGTDLEVGMCTDLESAFPRLVAAGYEKTSEKTGIPPKDGAYNCIAWAAGDTRHWWWPSDDAYWPFKGKRENTVDCFARGFRKLGYRACSTSTYQVLFERIALYAFNGEPSHMARQLRDGNWTSKLGPDEDITHYTLDAIESYGPRFFKAEYGCPVLYLRRFIVVSWVVRLWQFLSWNLKGRR